MPNLIVLSGPRKGVVLPVEGTLLIGRSPPADLRLPDFLVSTQHARLEVVQDGIVLEDLSSTNGTFCNGARVHTKTLLSLGDVLHIGTTDLMLTDHDRYDPSLLEEASAPSVLTAGVDTEAAVISSAPTDEGTVVLPLLHLVERAFSAAPDLPKLVERVAVYLARAARSRVVTVILHRSDGAAVVRSLRVLGGGDVEEVEGEPFERSEVRRASAERVPHVAFSSTGWSLYAPLLGPHGVLGAVVAAGVEEAPPPEAGELNQAAVITKLAALHIHNHMLVEALRDRNRELEEARARLATWNESLEATVQERAAEARLLSRMVESVPEAVISVDLEGVVTSWNPGAERLYGYQRGEVLGEVLPVIPDARVGEFERLLSAAGEGRTCSLRSERVSRDDRSIPVVLTVAPVIGPEGRVEGVVEIARDNTEQLEREEALRRRERVNSFADVAAGLGHELGNPLANLSSGVELLLSEPPAPDQAREVLEVLRAELRRLRRLVRETLNLDMWRRPERRETEARAVLEQVASAVRPRANGAGVEVALEVRVDADGAFLADVDQLQQALLNLCSNALEAMPDGGRLTLSSSADAEWVTLSVSDTGAGVDPADQDRIFDLYYTRRPGGSGIGLAIVRRIVDMHRGRVSLESEPGRGATFRLSFPRESE